MYRLDITDNRGDNRTQLSEIDLFEKNVSRIDRSVFSSKWESAGKEDQWVYIDLGTICRINKVKLFWGEEFARSYQIQFSTDKRNWRSLYSTNEGKGGIEEIKTDYGNCEICKAIYDRRYFGALFFGRDGSLWDGRSNPETNGCSVYGKKGLII